MRLLGVLVAILSGVLLSCPWFFSDSGFGVLVVMLGFVPLLWFKNKIEQNQKAQNSTKKTSFLWYVYIAMLIWNGISTWWVCNATIAGGIAAIVLNAGLMCIPFAGYRWASRHLNARIAGIAFVIFWLWFEYIHLNWDISWPWLTLGNALAFRPEVAQWYEYTGVLGGSLWFLVGNLLICQVILTNNKSQILALAMVIVLPIVFSLYLYNSTIPNDDTKTVEVIVVQPNIDPYTEKFAHLPNFIPLEQQLQRFIALSDSLRTPKTALVFWPETAFDGSYNEKNAEEDPVIMQIKKYQNLHPGSALITGIVSYIAFEDTTNLPPTVRFREYRGYYDLYNTAMMVYQNSLKFYHKSKLVPGVEGLPYPGFLKFLSVFSIDLGGSAGGLGRQAERTVFEGPQNIRLASTICYESIYGEFVGEFVKNGANLIAIITNDGWWGNTPGHRQHLSYARLRAIETRRYIARSANTGISGFLDPLGNVYQPAPYWQQHVRGQEIPLNSRLTFYVKHGDFLGDISFWVGVFLVFVLLFNRKKVGRQFLENKVGWLVIQ